MRQGLGDRGDSGVVADGAHSRLVDGHDPGPGWRDPAGERRRKYGTRVSGEADGLEGTAGGSTWKPVTVPTLENQSIRTILTSPKLVIVASRGRASVSSDRGNTWTHLPLPVPGLEWEGFAINPLDDSIVAATSHGIFLYLGNRWVPGNGAGPSTVSGVFFHPHFSNLAFAAQQSAVVYSSDGGRNWRALQRSGIPVSAQIKSLTFLPSEPDRMIALVARRGVYTTLIDPQVLRQPSTNQETNP